MGNYGKAKRKAQAPIEYYTCPICGEDDFKFSEFDHKEDMCYSCLEDGASEEMEYWLRSDYNSRCTL